MRTSPSRSPVPILVLAFCLLAAVLVAVGGPARASAPGPVLLSPTPGVGEQTARTTPKLVAAIQRDLHLTRAQAITRLGRQHASDAVEVRARRAAGRYFAGSWTNGDGSALMVAVTDQRVASAVRAAGANPTLVAHRRGSLELAGLRLQAYASKTSSKAVYGWRVDPARNRLVVTVAAGAQRAAAQWVAGAGVSAELTAYEQMAAPPTATATVRGGDGYLNKLSGSRCTTGFGVRPLGAADVLGTNGFVTAGHCVDRGNFIDLNTFDGLGAGRTNQSSFPLPAPVTPSTRTFDRAFVQFNPGLGHQAAPTVLADVGTIPVLGSAAAQIGEIVCSFGMTSGFRCGPVLTTNQNLLVEFVDGVRNLGRVTVLGLNQARFCSSPGDSGGPVITPGTGQAQGTLVSTTCTGVGNSSFYQPINMTQLGLNVRLLMPSAPPPAPPLLITAFFCDAFGEYDYAVYSCELYWEGGTEPDQVSISSNGSQARRVNDFDNNYVFVSGQCNPYQDTYVSVSVFDDSGGRVDDSRSSFCPR